MEIITLIFVYKFEQIQVNKVSVNSTEISWKIVITRDFLSKALTLLL